MRTAFPVFDEVRAACFDVLVDAGHIPRDRLREAMRVVERQVYEEFEKLPEDRTPHQLAWTVTAQVADEGGDLGLIEALRRKFFDRYGTPKG